MFARETLPPHAHQASDVTRGRRWFLGKTVRCGPKVRVSLTGPCCRADYQIGLSDRRVHEFTHAGGQCLDAERLDEHMHARLELAGTDRRPLRVAGDEQRPQARTH